MCGRFTLRTAASILAEFFGLTAELNLALPQLVLRYNIAPTQEVLVVRIAPESSTDSLPQGLQQRQPAMLRWGLIPSWAKEPGIGSRMINARAETVADKPAFRAPFRRRRCLVVADGYYEWQKLGNRKQPLYFRMPDEQPFAFAGIWERWSGGSGSSSSGLAEGTLETCSILTTAATPPMQQYHHRMPVILERADFDSWLDPSLQDREALEPLLVGYQGPMQIDPVSTLVNSPKNDSPRCLEIQRELF